MARITSEISNRITALRFPLMVGVVLIHSQGSVVNFADGTIGLQSPPHSALFLQELFGDVFARVAVPFFFLISSFLLFSSLQLNLKSYKQKMTSRIRTLVIPYIFWTVATLAAVRIAQSIPGLSPYFSGGSVYSIDLKHLTGFELLNLFVGLTHDPIVYPFWFIRDLIILVILSPVFLYLAQRAALPTFVICLVIWFLQPEFISIPSSASVIFFFGGALWAVQKISIEQLNRLGYRIVPIYLVLAIADAASEKSFYSSQLHAITVLVGIAFFWYLAGKCARNKMSFEVLTWLSSFSFFVCAAHAPIMTVTKKLVYKFLVPTNAVEITLLYFLVPSLTILICLTAGTLFRDRLPGLYKVATGGR